jgi:hypothetical protein
MEMSFFSAHSVFKRCNPSLYGVNQLSKKLTHLLVEKIKQEMVI